MSKKIVCFGEVLWDVLPNEKIAGGAPMNVSIRLQSLGIETKMISKIGNDNLGKELLSCIKEKNVDTSLIQIDEKLATGEVIVKLDSKGSATYDIVYPSAWDNILISQDNIEAVREADAFVFGSLASRDIITRNTLLTLLREAKFKIFDVNIRPPFFSFSFLKDLMELSDFIKLNDEELLEICSEFGSNAEVIEENIVFLSKLTNTRTICVTKGKDGAILYIDNQFYKHNGFVIKVIDTIGAGDSFLASFLSQFLYTKDYNKAIEFGCAIGALVASNKGANPEISSEEINKLINISMH